MTYLKQSSSLSSVYWRSSILEPEVGGLSTPSLLPISSQSSPSVLLFTLISSGSSLSPESEATAGTAGPRIHTQQLELSRGFPTACLPGSRLHAYQPSFHSTASSGFPTRVSRQGTPGTYSCAVNEDGHSDLHKWGSSPPCLLLPGSPCKAPGSCPPRAAFRSCAALKGGKQEKILRIRTIDVDLQGHV